MPGFVSLTNKATGQTEVVDTAAVPAALASGKYADPGAVAVHDNGLDTYAAPSVARQDQAFTPTIDPGLAQVAAGHHLREQANTGLAAAGRAGLGGLASGLSAGLVSPFEDEQEFNPGVAFAGTAIGAIAPALVGDEAGLAGLARFTPAGAISRLGAGIGEGLGAGVLAKGAAGAAEGTLFGAGQGVGEVARSDDPLTWERAASTIGSNALFGGAAGGALGLAGGAVERALKSGQSAIEARLAGAARDSEVLAAAPDLMTLDAKGLKAARDTELESIRTAQLPEREAFAQALAEHSDSTIAERLSKFTSTSDNVLVRGTGIDNKAANAGVLRLLRNKAELIRNPEVALKTLEAQGQALARINKAADEEIGAYLETFRNAPETIRRDIVDGKVKGMVVGPGGLSPASPVIDQEVERQMIARYGTTDTRTGPLSAKWPARLEVAYNISAAETRVGDLYRTIKRLTAEPASERLAAIDAARETLNTPHVPSLGERLLHHVPGGGLVAELAGVASRPMGAMRQAIAKGARRTGEAVSAFAGGAASVAGSATPIASKILSEVSYGPAAEKAAAMGAPTSLPALYTARTNEIKAQTAYDQTGVPRIRPAARQAIADRLHPIRVADPVLADRLETLAVRRMEYLSSLLPRRPDFGGLQTGPDRYHPPDMMMRSFARSAAAVEDPGGVEERVAHGTVTPEDAAAYWGVYPERARHYQQQVMMQLPSLQKTLPYQKRLSLGIFTGIPVDPSMNPKVLAMLQGQFPAEDGSDGGTAAPKAAPQFGSIKKSVDQPTPAQHRAQGAA